MSLDPKDGGMSSRKLWFSVGTGSTITAAWLLTAKFAALRPTFETVVGALIALAGVYLTGNIASRWVTGKALKGTATAAVEPEAEEESVGKKRKKKKDNGVTEEGG